MPAAPTTAAGRAASTARGVTDGVPSHAERIRNISASFAAAARHRYEPDAQGSPQRVVPSIMWSGVAFDAMAEEPSGPTDPQGVPAASPGVVIPAEGRLQDSTSRWFTGFDAEAATATHAAALHRATVAMSARGDDSDHDAAFDLAMTKVSTPSSSGGGMPQVVRYRTAASRRDAQLGRPAAVGWNGPSRVGSSGGSRGTKRAASNVKAALLAVGASTMAFDDVLTADGLSGMAAWSDELLKRQQVDAGASLGSAAQIVVLRRGSSTTTLIPNTSAFRHVKPGNPSRPSNDLVSGSSPRSLFQRLEGSFNPSAAERPLPPVIPAAEREPMGDGRGADAPQTSHPFDNVPGSALLHAAVPTTDDARMQQWAMSCFAQPGLCSIAVTAERPLPQGIAIAPLLALAVRCLREPPPQRPNRHTTVRMIDASGWPYQRGVGPTTGPAVHIAPLLNELVPALLPAAATGFGAAGSEPYVIEDLILESCRLTDDDASYLATLLRNDEGNLTTLRRLSLQGNLISTIGADKLKKAVKYNAHVTVVNLSDNPVWHVAHPTAFAASMAAAASEEEVAEAQDVLQSLSERLQRNERGLPNRSGLSRLFCAP